jgi:hypothetical protein
MLIGIKATFNRFIDAKEAYKELEKSMKNEPQVDLSYYNPRGQNSEEPKDKLSVFMLIPYILGGVVFGLFLSIISYMLVMALGDVGLFAENLNGSFINVLFPILFIGGMIGMIFYFVTRERVITLAPNEIKHHDAVIRLTCPKEYLRRVERILRNYDADQVLIR